ncbi:MAG: ThuA domain-containing protein [Planctomycetia bacterium]|nr:ThuA domain-containing protein [Planctomycetia bacterium]
MLKRSFLSALLAGSFVFCTLFASTAFAQTIKPIRILLVVGGHGYDKPNLHKMLKEMPGAVLTEISLPESQDLLKPGLEKNYDVVVFHDQSRFPLSDSQKKNMEDLWANGMPTVMLHHALISHNDFPFMRDLFGCAYLVKPLEINGTKYPASSYFKPTDVPFIIKDKDHPITRGISDFTINDEVFDGLYLNPGIHVLAETDHAKSCKPIVFIWKYKKSSVFAMLQGHDGHAFNDPNYRKFLYQGINFITQTVNNQF